MNEILVLTIYRLYVLMKFLSEKFAYSSRKGGVWHCIIVWPSLYSLTGAEVGVDMHMLRLERGWGCAFCGYQSASTAAKVDVRRHIRRQHFGLVGSR